MDAIFQHYFLSNNKTCLIGVDEVGNHLIGHKIDMETKLYIMTIKLDIYLIKIYTLFKGVIKMEKNELLKRIENHQIPDEREVIIKKFSYSWGYMGGLLSIMGLVAIRYFSGEIFSQDLLMILFGQLTWMSLYEYLKNRENKVNLLFTIFGLFLFLGTLYNTLVFYEYL